MGFGKSLKSLLEDRGIKQNELAAKIGISESTLSSMINRDVEKVNIDIFLDICDAIGCDPTEFYRDYKRRSAYLSDTERQLLEDFRALNEDGQTAALAAVHGFTLADQYKKCNQISDIS